MYDKIHELIMVTLNNKSINSLVYPKEQVYFILAIILSLVFYLLIGLITFVLISTNQKTIPTFIFYIVLIIGVFIIVQGLFIGHMKNNSIKVNLNQFPEIFDVTNDISATLNLNEPPNVYVTESGGILNAFATRFLFRDFVIIYSDILELAYEKGEEAVKFVLCHELSHVKLKHIDKNIFLFPARLIPFFGYAYSRACEYSCDRIAASMYPTGAKEGISVLASGKKLYKKVNVEDFMKQSDKNYDFWCWLAEILSTHPPLHKRLAEVIKFSGSNYLKEAEQLQMVPSEVS